MLNLTPQLRLVSWILSHMIPHTHYIQLQHLSGNDPSSVPRKAPSRTKPGQNTLCKAGPWKLLCSHTRLATGYLILGWGIGGLAIRHAGWWRFSQTSSLVWIISSNTWRLAYWEGYEDRNKFMILQAPLLHYRYLMADKVLRTGISTSSYCT